MMRRILAIAGVGAALLQPAAAQTTFTTLGRLFTTPAERMALDQQRNITAVQKTDGQAAPGAAAGAAPVAGMPGQGAGAAAAPPPPPPPPPVRLDGVVRRSNGQATIWVDNQPREATVRGSPGAGVAVDMGGRQVRLKPGQSYDPNSGMVLDAQPAR